MYQHPPNKREFYMKGIIPLALQALKAFPTSKTIHQQGLSALFCVLAKDPQNKFNVASARTQALANGIVDVLQHARASFKTSVDITVTVRALEEVIIQDWS
jgi:hypothetical protein